MPPSTGRGVLRDPRLWITVCLVAVLALAWQGILTALNLSVASDTEDFLPLAIFLVPVLYASTTFGLNGGLVVASASAVATVPWAVQATSAGNKAGAWFDAVQVFVLLVLAYFVGKTVDAEREARWRPSAPVRTTSWPRCVTATCSSRTANRSSSSTSRGRSRRPTSPPRASSGTVLERWKARRSRTSSATRPSWPCARGATAERRSASTPTTARPTPPSAPPRASSRSKASRCSRSCSWT